MPEGWRGEWDGEPGPLRATKWFLAPISFSEIQNVPVFSARRLLTRFSFPLIYGTVDRCSGRSLANIIMTIDEALQAIKGSLECLVTLRGDTGEILVAKHLTSESSDEDRRACLCPVTSVPFGAHTVSRFLESASVTSASLSDWVEETRCAYESINARVKIINGWRYQQLSDLVAILESGDFPCPTTPNDSYILLEFIFDVRDRELNPDLIQRLWAVADSQQVEISGKPFASTLRLSLWRYEMKTAEFVRYWHEHLRGGMVPFLIGPSKFAGDLRITDQVIVNDVIGLVRAQWPFGLKERAMISLGKIGPPAGSEAARAIREEVYDSTDWIIAQRDRVLARIETAPGLWRDCNNCRRGKIVDDSSGIFILRDCPECYGLGLIPSSC